VDVVEARRVMNVWRSTRRKARPAVAIIYDYFPP
jgi:hypothetical protein